MIISRIKGGIGNQLFIYAASRSLSLRNKMSLVLDDVSGFAYDTKYNRHYQLDNFNIFSRKATPTERLEPFSRIRRYIKRSINRNFAFDKKSYIFEEDNKDFEKKLLNLHLRGKVFIEGYFQSENYFKDFEDQIRKDLIIKPPKDNKNLITLRKINDKVSIAIHLRFLDKNKVDQKNYVKNEDYDLIEYYNRAIMKMTQNFTEAHFFVFSNQPDKIKENIKLDQKRMTIVDWNLVDKFAYADLWLMTNCKHFIITKSTFGWWGAWLANNKNKIIITPEINDNLTNFWNNRSLIPKNWIQL
jgi:hypothetical protein